MEPQKKIAIIDKEAMLIGVLSDFARDFGYEVAAMQVNKNTQPEYVATFVKEHKPNLILLAENYMKFNDIEKDFKAAQDGETAMRIFASFKRGEGIEALVKIRETDKTTPIVMVSSQPCYKERALNAGADGYYEHPAHNGFKEFIDLLASI